MIIINKKYKYFFINTPGYIDEDKIDKIIYKLKKAIINSYTEKSK